MDEEEDGRALPAPAAGPVRAPVRDPYACDIRLGWRGWLVVAALGVVMLDGSQGGSRVVESRFLKPTRVTARAIARAVEAYADRQGGRFPGPGAASSPAGGGDTDTDTDTSPASGLVAELAGAGPERGVGLLFAVKAADPSTRVPEGWRDGVVREAGRWAVYDRYGGVFHVRMDTDGDGQVENPNPDERAEGMTRLQKRVAVWTDGKDRKEETWDGNAMSWQGGWTDRLPW